MLHEYTERLYLPAAGVVVAEKAVVESAGETDEAGVEVEVSQG